MKISSLNMSAASVELPNEISGNQVDAVGADC
ncbi:hypothetical protein Kfla_4544 [Kribbella flavida DSM 17836]|uniref:Uncharacterized protein n=1 Tax=Kribbella flavida (strain DSM 17836 / JCM 10339 / NBRC 14399) TaxID=479435 RepID=D2PXW2_KRIFD|nr:hypothetical protein Kfla_4544 [Kribbella flavida DSM 17836]